MVILAAFFPISSFICNVYMCTFTTYFHVNIIKTSPSSTNRRDRVGSQVLAGFTEVINMLQDPIKGIKSITEVYIRD